jgi:hypothetical protein
LKNSAEFNADSDRFLPAKFRTDDEIPWSREEMPSNKDGIQIKEQNNNLSGAQGQKYRCLRGQQSLSDLFFKERKLLNLSLKTKNKGNGS